MTLVNRIYRSRRRAAPEPVLQIVPETTIPKTLKERAKALRNAVILGGFSYDDHWFDADEHAQLNITSQATYLTLGLPEAFPLMWTDFDNHDYEVRSSRDFGRMVSAMHAHLSRSHEAYRWIKSELASGRSPVISDAPWPPTRLQIATF